MYCDIVLVTSPGRYNIRATRLETLQQQILLRAILDKKKLFLSATNKENLLHGGW